MKPVIAKNSSKRHINVAVVGLGLMGVTHLKAYQQIKSARIVAVVDRVRVPVQGVLAGANGNTGGADIIRLGADVKAYRDIEEVLADSDVDLVSICTPTIVHGSQALAALRAGKHVVCEKPLARTSALARKIVTVAETAPGYFMPAMCMRFWPGWAWLKELIRNEKYGKVLAARFRRLSAPPAWGQKHYFDGAESGGALLDLHIHDTDFVQYLFGRPLSVFSTGRSVLSGAIDHVVTQYCVTGGAAVHAEGSWLNAGGFSMAYTIHFEKMTLDFDSRRGAEALVQTASGKTAKILKIDTGDGYVRELREMIRCIQAGTPPTIVTAEDAWHAVKICEAEECSIRTGKVVRIT
jgi:predicted dehydrogenase